MRDTETPLTHIGRQAERHTIIAAFLRAHDDLLTPLGYTAMSAKMPDLDYDQLPHVECYADGYHVAISVNGPDQRETMRMLRKAIGGQWEKRDRGNAFVLHRNWCPPFDEGLVSDPTTVGIEISGNREEVCQRVVTGTETVEVPEVEYQPARTEEREVVEWVCGNLLTD